MALHNGAIAATEAGALPGLGPVNLVGTTLESKSSEVNELFKNYAAAAAESGEVTTATTAGGSSSTSTRPTLNTR